MIYPKSLARRLPCDSTLVDSDDDDDICVGCIEIGRLSRNGCGYDIAASEAESACFIHKHKPLGDILRMPESRLV